MCVKEKVWRPVGGFEGFYEISIDGCVRSVTRFDRLGRLHKAQPIKTKKNNRGYVQIRLYRDGQCYHKLLHRLVAENFIPNTRGLAQVNHKDEDKTNNHAQNIEWCDNLYNRRYGTGYARSVANHDYVKIAEGNRKPVKQYDKNGNFVKRWDAVVLAARSLGLHESGIRQCCYGKRKTHGNFGWKFA